ncbi:uncharacterized protein LOC129456865 [Periophthalmus magnuspinnatus]|uniref:uncharacterized protein LOC129456865 n=1 Tax=Periophthalmus magnuspinnatus TaxID=409849 RepID=UPI002436E87B|nr:uncharacterized protein LOC129456865 [Periophthalmus magnuspinnatus]
MCSETNGQDLVAPILSVEPEIITKTGSVRLNCQTPVPVTECFYSFGKLPSKNMPCRHSLNGSALLSLLSRVSPGEVSVACFYLNLTASPQSESKVIHVQDLGPPTLSVYPPVITEYTTVTLYCQPPHYVSASRCSFYSLSGLKFGGSSCVQTLRGSDLLKKRHPPVEEQIKCYYFENESPSPHSNKTTVAVKGICSFNLFAKQNEFCHCAKNYIRHHHHNNNNVPNNSTFIELWNNNKPRDNHEPKSCRKCDCEDSHLR